jgi:hypothetical protein
VGLVTFGEEAIVRWNLKQFSNAQDIVDAIHLDSSIPPGTGKANMYKGLNKMRTQMFSESFGAHSDTKRIAIIISDGKYYRNKSATVPEAQLAREENITILTIGVTPDILEDRMKNVSSLDTRLTEIQQETQSKKYYWPLYYYDMTQNVTDEVSSATNSFVCIGKLKVRFRRGEQGRMNRSSVNKALY